MSQVNPTAGREVPVTALIPAYNRPDMARRAIESVLGQSTVRPAEILVIDDGSADDTADVAESYGVRVIRHEQNKGLSEARNTGLRAASNPWIALLDSDDEWLPHHLATLWPLIDGHVLVGATGLRCAAEPGGERIQGIAARRPMVFRSPADLFMDNYLHVSATMFRRDVAIDVGGFRAYDGVLEDLDFWIRVLDSGSGIITPTVSARIYLHGDQMSKHLRQMHNAHDAVVNAYSDRAWWSRAAVERWRGRASWDEVRAARSEGKALQAARLAFGMVRTPNRLVGWIATLWKRFSDRRASSRVARDGGPSVALLPGSTPSPSGTPQSWGATVDLRSAGRASALAALLHRPTAFATSARSLEVPILATSRIHALRKGAMPPASVLPESSPASKPGLLTRATVSLTGAPPDVAPEHELLLLLFGTRERRAAASGRIEELVEQARMDVFLALAAAHQLLPLAVGRLQASSTMLPPELATQLGGIASTARLRGLALETVMLSLVGDLESESIPALPIKGPALGRILYDDPGARDFADLDLLVDASQLELSKLVVSRRGYMSADAGEPLSGRPLLHRAMRYENAELPPVELHWRIHWYRSKFSEEMLARSVWQGDARRAPHDYEVASLLLFLARDGFQDVRLAADIAAWWDRYGAQQDGEPVLSSMVERHPELESALRVSALVVESWVGVPADQICPDAHFASRRERAAARLANWTGVGVRDQLFSNMSLVDGLLAPPGGVTEFARRALVPPEERIREWYELDGRSRFLIGFWQIVHGPKILMRYALALTQVRGGKRWVNLPAARALERESR